MAHALALWAERDAVSSLHAADRAAIVSTGAARALVLQCLVEGALRDLFNACARFGQLLAEAGASPTLAASTLDAGIGACEASGAPSIAPALRGPARASIAEGYVQHRIEQAAMEAARAWEYPTCAVRIDGKTAAFAVAAPVENVADWAGRVASAAARDGVRRAILSSAAAKNVRAEFEAAFSLVGVEVVGEANTTRSWLPWRR